MNAEITKTIENISNCNNKELKTLILEYKERSNDEFSQVLRNISVLTYNDLNYKYYNPIGYFVFFYSLDGNRKRTYEKLCTFLYDELKDVSKEVINELTKLKNLFN